MKYSRGNLVALVAKLKVLGISEPVIWVHADHSKDVLFMKHVPVSELSINEARRNWTHIQHEITMALKRHKKGNQ